MRVDSALQGLGAAQFSVTTINNILERMNIGDILKASVADMSSQGNEIILKLADGSIIKALFTAEASVQPGDLIELAMAGKSPSGTTILQLVKSNGVSVEPSNSELNTALKKLGVKPDAMNVEIIKELKSAGITPTKELFHKVSGLLDKHSELTPAKAIFIAIHELYIPETGGSNTPGVLSQFLEGKIKLGSRLLSLKNALAEIKGTDSAVSEKLMSIERSIDSLFIKTGKTDLSIKDLLPAEKTFKGYSGLLSDIRIALKSLKTGPNNEIFRQLEIAESELFLLNRVNESSILLQFPLNINGHETTAELYVFKKKGGKKPLNPENMILLIALDTANMGRVETVLDIKGTKISIGFRAENQKILDFAKKSFKELYDGLLRAGYSLVDIKYKIIKEKASPVNAEKTAMQETSAGRYVIDYRI
jgi:hypothetical protein